MIEIADWKPVPANRKIIEKGLEGARGTVCAHLCTRIQGTCVSDNVSLGIGSEVFKSPHPVQCFYLFT